MLVEFKIGNYLSFHSLNNLSFQATQIKSGNENTFLPPSLQWDYRLLRSVGLMGFNSAGKSNFLKAIGAMKYAVLYSGVTSENVFRSSVAPFLLLKGNMEPSLFEVTFFLNNRKYRYGYKIHNSVVHQEWLYYAEPKIREQHLFVRVGQNIDFNNAWNKQNDSAIPILFKRAQEHTLFLSVLGVLNIEPAVEIIEWFKRIVVIETFDSEAFINITSEHLSDTNFRYNFTQILKQAKLGFSTIFERKLSDAETSGRVSSSFMDFMIQNELIPKSRYSVQTVHPIFNEHGIEDGAVNFDLRTQESAGTKKFFGLVGLLLDAMANKRILLFDELDAQFHFAMYETLVGVFNNPKINPFGAQMIFTTHNTTLLKKSKIRRDQLYTVEKGALGDSKIKRMHEKGNTIRTDASLEKEYTEGNLKVHHPNIQFELFTGLLDFPA